MATNKQKWLQVNTDYSGIDTNGLVIRAGVYPVGAPELYGAADGLIEHGAAEWVDAPEAVEDAPVEESLEHPDWETTSNKQIAKWLEEKGYDVTGWKTKADLIAIYGEGSE